MLATKLFLFFCAIHTSFARSPLAALGVLGSSFDNDQYPLSKGRHVIDTGERQPGDELLYSDRPIEKGDRIPLPKQVGKEYCYPPRGANDQVKITEYEVKDLDTGDDGGLAYDVSGGVEQNQVCVYLKTKLGGSYHYKIDVYGFRLNNRGFNKLGGMETGNYLGSGNANYNLPGNNGRTRKFGDMGMHGGTGNYGGPENNYQGPGNLGGPENNYRGSGNYGGPENNYRGPGNYGGPENNYRGPGNYGGSENNYRGPENYGGPRNLGGIRGPGNNGGLGNNGGIGSDSFRGQNSFGNGVGYGSGGFGSGNSYDAGGQNGGAFGNNDPNYNNNDDNIGSDTPSLK